jgi:CDP-4-dehydro-6-deoxyglucose reductase
VYSAQTERDLVDTGRMAWWAAKHRRFNFVPTYTQRPPDGARHTGRIPSMLDQIADDLSGYSVYIAGSPEFVDDCTDAALALGANTARVFVERYHPAAG